MLAAIRGEDSYGHKIIKDMKPYAELSESTSGGTCEIKTTTGDIKMK